MKILVVGGAGFIGHNVSKSLEAHGHDVVIMDNLTTYGVVDQDLLDKLMVDRLDGFNGRIVNHNISNQATRYEVQYTAADVIIHLASFPRAKIVNENPQIGANTMVDGLFNILNGAVAGNVKQFIYISSSMVYGDFEGGIDEDGDKKPGSIYASLKLAGEQITKQFAKKHNFEYTIIRPSAVYGPLDVEDRVVSKFIMNAVNNKLLSVNGIDERLDFTYVDDIVDGIVSAVGNSNGYNETFNMTLGRDESIYDAAHVAIDTVGKGEVFITQKNPDMPSRGYLSINKARRLLNYNPSTSIKEGFQLYYDWVKQFYSI